MASSRKAHCAKAQTMKTLKPETSCLDFIHFLQCFHSLYSMSFSMVCLPATGQQPTGGRKSTKYTNYERTARNI
jgi:hypothetical protein